MTKRLCGAVSVSVDETAPPLCESPNTLEVLPAGTPRRISLLTFVLNQFEKHLQGIDRFLDACDRVSSDGVARNGWAHDAPAPQKVVSTAARDGPEVSLTISLAKRGSG